ncbi:hypothetical protein COLO4_35593 [Corchorus olitorius]|uniref:Uncharacterized protein n=1 Tax=Corchorus olitorius TaxID=93759 RepID=A0A1R3GEZ1_9ROSI|nr:hypothetical protein COLO4_35593 [Corchorus olitorius]
MNPMAPFFCFGLVPNLDGRKFGISRGFVDNPSTDRSDLDGFTVETASTSAISLHLFFSIGPGFNSGDAELA